jgi:Co/Zn/Cd efflux system component
MGVRLVGNKRLYLLAIIYIVIFTIIFKFIYPEVPATSLTIVIALLGFIFALGSNFVINRIKQKRGKNDCK